MSSLDPGPDPDASSGLAPLKILAGQADDEEVAAVVAALMVCSRTPAATSTDDRPSDWAGYWRQDRRNSRQTRRAVVRS